MYIDGQYNPIFSVWNGSGQRITVIFAYGPHVALNAIVGLPFLKSTGIIMDLNDSVLVTMVDRCPFPI